MPNFKLKYINTNSAFYQQAVSIRKELFFKNMENSSKLIEDAHEANGLHLVCLEEEKVIGTGRLNIEVNTSIISQMAISSQYQKQGVGSQLLRELIRYSKEKGISKIVLSARETAIDFYSKFNFKPTGALYPSLKTGIIHQNMELKDI
ncbi:GNAT family N-acetyltransferase [Seonamhaeicola marinus]|uniref:GNAT family N-acetyltransferase n=1 Tax=Seonamhaeicola marinus TaxID=1912246 RepID=A0A5D0HZ70_9FLAO|nr:GNAT family N-acetyltransferase [Seonamhaeicola marinus]TYA74792.1 GNAT family N-acetyltransferase [Seonamhaeicola marinus]